MAEAARPVLVVGNSYAGAIIAALRRPDAPAAAERIDVAAAGGGNYRLIAIEDGRIVRARLYRQRNLPIADYAAIFNYGYLPHPIELALMRRRLVKQRFSAQVTTLALRDAVTTADSLLLQRRFRTATAAPILVLPGNPAVNAAATDAAEREDMAALLRELVGPAYFGPPDGFLDEEGRPIHAFYKGSVTITGEFTADPHQAKHDMLHLNAEGGALWLSAILNKLGELDEVGGND